MTETQKRIKAYKDALPGLRERVTAVALLLAISMAMMTSATFAWLTISRSPEVSGVNTTVAANGNLEIALVTGNGKVAPGESQVGDSPGTYYGKQLLGYQFKDGVGVPKSEGDESTDETEAASKVTSVYAMAEFAKTSATDAPTAAQMTEASERYSAESYIKDSNELVTIYTSSAVTTESAVGYQISTYATNADGTYTSEIHFGFSDDEADYALDANGSKIPYYIDKDVYRETAGSEAAVGTADSYQIIYGSNNTWGNLVNLSDPAYGLENMVLRPAQLNEFNLTNSPLYSASYGGDGRVTGMDSSFKYAIWDAEMQRFVVTTDYGVRAIASSTTEAVGATGRYAEKLENLDILNRQAANTYAAIGQNTGYMETLGTLVGAYMDRNLNGTDPTISGTTILSLIDMYGTLIDAYEMEAQAVAALVNLNQWFVKGDIGGTTTPNYTEVTAAQMLINANNNDYPDKVDELLSNGTLSAIQLKSMKQFIRDYQTVVSDRATLMNLLGIYVNADGDYTDANGIVLSEDEKSQIVSQSSFTWTGSKIDTIVYHLVNPGVCLLNGTPISSYNTSNIGAVLDALSGSNNVVTINNGILKNFELRTGGRISAPVTVTVKYIITVTVNATVVTDVNACHFTEDQLATEANKPAEFAGGTSVAEDTYGMAVDLWVRTNARSSYLTLEGNVLTRTDYVQAYGKDASGQETELWVVSIPAGTVAGIAMTEDVDLYLVETTAEDGTVTKTFYLHENHAVFLVQTVSGDTTTSTFYDRETGSAMTAEQTSGYSEPKKKTVEQITPIGYSGENRIWDGDSNALINADSTTQGSGSCYVYYADTPEEQARSLKLLEAFNVAFVDGNGKLLATAYMDTEMAYKETGRVTVPLVLSETKSTVYTSAETGGDAYAIMPLEQNVATRVTAIIYLDGTNLTNDQVLAASDIQGRLNIQFGSSEALVPKDDDDLASKALSVSATIDNTAFDYDTHVGDMITNISVTVDGDTPGTVTAFFSRAISDTQGTREYTVNLKYNEATGNWESPYKFDSPGNYILRTVQLDGRDYDLDTPLTVTITGFALESLLCNEAVNGKINVMSAESSTTANLTLRFVADDVDKLPKKVQGKFIRDGGSSVNVEFTYNTNGTWTGQARFLASGTYYMDYLVLDGNYMSLEESMCLEATVNLGMRVQVYTSSPIRITYLPSEMAENEKNLNMYAKILDNSGTEMKGLPNVLLTYVPSGSGTKSMQSYLKWDSSQGYYTGLMTNGGPGVWSFSSVTVGSSILTNATTSPTFTVMSPEPPEYVDHSTQSNIFDLTNSAFMNARLAHTEGAKVRAIIVKAGETTEYEVEGTQIETTGDKDYPITSWRFTVPKTADGKQDGTWTIVSLEVYDAFAPDGTEYTSEAPMVIDVSDTNNTIRVVGTVTIAYPEDKSQNFGLDENGNVTGQFMQKHTFNGMSVQIKDFEDKEIPNVTDVTLWFLHDAGTNAKDEYGGYSSTVLDGTHTSEIIQVPLTQQADGITYAQQTNATIQIAGTYTAVVSYKLGGVQYATGQCPVYGSTNANSAITGGNVPNLAVYSVKPTVTVTGVSPTSEVRLYPSATPTETDYNNIITGNFNKVSEDGFTATTYVYFKLQNNLDNEAVEVQLPTVTLALSGISNDVTVTGTVSIGNDANSSYGHSATISGNTATLTVGGGENGVMGWGNLSIDTYPKIYPAGTQEIKTVILTHDGITYTVNLSNTVTINNPLIPDQASFTVSDTTYTGDSIMKYFVSGEKITIPSLSWVVIPDGATVNYNSSVYEETDEVAYYYTERGELGWFTINYYYKTHTVKTVKYTGTVAANTRYVEYWVDSSGNKYYPGEQHSLADGTTLTAGNIIEQDSGGQTITVVGYGTKVSSSSESKNKPDTSIYTKVDDAPTDTAPTVWTKKED